MNPPRGHHLSLPTLLQNQRIEPVPSDLEAAWDRIADAERHIASAETLAASDRSLAYVGLYDACRKAIVAHMIAHGYRITNQPGAHEATGHYGVDAFGNHPGRQHFERFDEMRRIRNRSEYGTGPITETLVTSDLVHTRAIVAAVRESLPADPRNT